MSTPITSYDHSVAYSCLLDLYPWYGQADSRHTPAVTDRLVEAWRAAVAAGDRVDCYTLARLMEDELKDALDAAIRADES